MIILILVPKLSQKVTSSSLWPRHPGLDNYKLTGNNFDKNLYNHRLGSGYGQPTRSYPTPQSSYSYQYESKPEPTIECDYVPRENCTKIEGSRNCKQIPKLVPEQICISDIPVQKVREECTDVTRQGTENFL